MFTASSACASCRARNCRSPFVRPMVAASITELTMPEGVGVGVAWGAMNALALLGCAELGIPCAPAARAASYWASSARLLIMRSAFAVFHNRMSLTLLSYSLAACGVRNPLLGGAGTGFNVVQTVPCHS